MDIRDTKRVLGNGLRRVRVITKQSRKRKVGREGKRKGDGGEELAISVSASSIDGAINRCVISIKI